MTYKKIAELANVSVSTVSKALSGSKEISAELTDKIIQIAIETGYFKEKSKRKLNSSKEKNAVIAVLCPEIISIHYSNIVTIIKNTVEENGGQLAIFVFDFNHDKLNRIAETLILKKAADGIILLTKKQLNFKPTIPILYLDSHDDEDSVDNIFSSSQLILDIAVTHLKELGHKKIGFIGETLTLSKLAAFKLAMDKNNLPVDNAFIYTSKERFENNGFTAVKQMLRNGSLPTALITAYDEIALAVIHELSLNNIKVPDDISVIGINNIPPAAYSQIPLTTISTFSKERCISAINILFDKIFDKPKSVKHIQFKPELIIRSSTGKPKNTDS